MQSHSLLRLAIMSVFGVSALAVVSAQAADAPVTDQQSIEALRNTLVGVMEALVQKGLLTREQAAQIVASAQAKADTTAKDKAAQEAAEKNAVIVTRIPETVKQDIVKQVGNELRPLIKDDVLADAKAKKWGVPGAMPEWLSRIKLSGDLRFRVQQDTFAKANTETGLGDKTYPNYLAINAKGGFEAAGFDAYWNVSQDRLRERLRARLAMDARVTDGVNAVLRLATGSLTDPVSTNQTLGQSGNRYQFSVDQAYLKYSATGAAKIPWMNVSVGRAPNPWLSTDLVWDPDLQFEGLSGTWRYILENDSTLPRNIFMTLGVFPLQEIELSSLDKWLYGAQLGVDFPWDGGGRLRLGSSYYYYDNITGRRNAVQDKKLDYTAPQYLQKGNTVFDIDNDTGPNAGNTRLFALAAKYHLLGLTAILDFPVLNHQVTLTTDYVKNIGYKQQDVLGQFGRSSLNEVPEGERLLFNERTTGWQAELAVGSRNVGKKGSWRSSIAYKHLERDAVVDAYTDSDFHLGGTGAEGYTIRGDWWFRDNNSLSLRYISSDEIARTQPSADGSVLFSEAFPFGVDTLMLDINAQF